MKRKLYATCSTPRIKRSDARNAADSPSSSPSFSPPSPLRDGNEQPLCRNIGFEYSTGDECTDHAASSFSEQFLEDEFGRNADTASPSSSTTSRPSISGTDPLEPERVMKKQKIHSSFSAEKGCADRTASVLPDLDCDLARDGGSATDAMPAERQQATSADSTARMFIHYSFLPQQASTPQSVVDGYHSSASHSCGSCDCCAVHGFGNVPLSVADSSNQLVPARVLVQTRPDGSFAIIFTSAPSNASTPNPPVATMKSTLLPSAAASTLPERDQALAPARKRRYTKEEDERLRELKEDWDLSWPVIADKLPGRTQSSLQARYNVLLNQVL